MAQVEPEVIPDNCPKSENLSDSERVEVKPVPLEITLEQRGPVVAAVPNQDQPALKGSEVECTMDMVRDSGVAKEAPATIQTKR